MRRNFSNIVPMLLSMLLLCAVIGCDDNTVAPTTQPEFKEWMNYIVNIPLEGGFNTGKTFGSYRNNPNDFSTWGIAGFTNRSTEKIDALLFAHIAPLGFIGSGDTTILTEYGAIFKEGTFANVNYTVNFDSITLQKFSNAYFAETSKLKRNSEEGVWRITPKSGTAISQSIKLPPTLTPMRVSADSFSLKDGGVIYWEKGNPEEYVSINFFNYADVAIVDGKLNFPANAYYTRGGIMTPDTGSYLLKKENFLYAGIKEGDKVLIQIIRGKFSIQEVGSFKNAGILTTTSAEIPVIIKE